MGKIKQVPSINRMKDRILAVILALISFISCAHRAPVGTTAICDAEMQSIYDEVKTPYKAGIIMVPEEGECLDNPTVFRYGDAWYMLYIRFDGKGYETHLAKSDNLVDWEKLGPVFKRGEEGSWDSSQADGWPILLDPEWEGTNELNTFDGKYWMMYLGGAFDGYETDPLSTGVAWTDDPSAVKQWTRYEGNPVLQSCDADAREFEKKTIYKHYVVEDETRSLGARFVTYYNAAREDAHAEAIGMAISDDLTHWNRYGDEAVIDNVTPGRHSISGDPMIRRIGDLWVMFYFGIGWREDIEGAFDTFACSRDLVHWTQWTGEPLIRPSEPWDKVHAHKPWVIKQDGIVYHFYCAVGEQGRGIALATSKPAEGSHVRPK